MPYRLGHKVISIFLTCFVLFSTLSFTVEKHFCGDTLIDVAIFDKVEKCTADNCGIDRDAVSKPSCCKDEVQIVQGQLHVKQEKSDASAVDYAHYASSIFTSSFLTCLPKHTIPYANYSPPIIIKDIHLLDETFLI